MTNDENDTQQNGRRSIRDIPIPRRRAATPRATDDVRPSRATKEPRESREVAREEEPVKFTAAEVEEDAPMPVRRAPTPAEEDSEEELPPQRTYRSDRSRRRSGGLIKKLLLVGVPVAAAIWLVTWHSASVTITEKRAAKDVSFTIPVSIGESATGTLSAKAVNVIARAEKSLPATGEATVQSKAGGTITIVNEYSGEEQTLVRNTRFQTPEGLVFRIQEPVTVPGKTATAGGTVEARVLADDVGEKYNVGPVARFTVPGFDGKPQFSSFYARSSAPMTGGFDGVQKVADPKLVADAVDELTEQLRGRMGSEAAAKAGQGYRAFTVPGSFAVLGTGREPAGQNVTVWVEAEADAFAVSDADFSDAVAAGVLVGYHEKGEARIDNPDALRVTPKEGSSPALEVNGHAELTWVVDLNSLESSLLGQPLSSFDQVVSRFGGIEKATPVVRPFWRSTFPSEANSIETTSEGDELVDG
jgi:hypothetical protein